jgi:ATP-binding cassette subfamily B protein
VQLQNTLKNKWYSIIYIPSEFKLIVVVIVSLIAAAVLGSYTPVAISNLFASLESHSRDFESACYFIGFLFVGEYFNRVIYQLSVNKYGQRAVQAVRVSSFSNWLNSYETIHQDKNHKDRYPKGEVISRLMNDTDAVLELLSSGSFSIFIDFVFIVACLVSFLKLNTISGIFLIIIEVLFCLFLFRASKVMAKIFMEVRKSISQMSRVLSNITAGLRDTFYTPNGNYASVKSARSFDHFLKIQLKANIWDASYFSLAESIYPIILAFLVFIFPYSRILEMAVLAAIIDLIQRSIAPIKDIAAKITNIQRAKTGLERIVEFNHDLDLLPHSNNFDAKMMKDFSRLKVKIADFQYGRDSHHQFSLKNIEFSAGHNQLVGIVGMSGSGKSTLLKILAADIICPTAILEIESLSGEMQRFSGVSFDEMAVFKKQISLVSQDSHIFTETLGFNIALGELNQKLEEFWLNVKQHIPYIEKWGVDLETRINPKEISLGQKQLISALRSCFYQKPIVLFDEISSALDSDLEEALRIMVLLIQKKSLTIIVAHRLETIIDADFLVMLSAGRVADIGTHRELSERCASYQDMITQLSSLEKQ